MASVQKASARERPPPRKWHGPGDLYVGPETTVKGTEHHPMADEPRGAHWEYFASC